MESQGLIQKIRTAVVDAQAKGYSVVPIPTLLTFLDDLASHATVSVAAAKFQSDVTLESYKGQQQASLELFRSVVQAGQATLRTAMIINGGAAAALLAFIGNIWSRASAAGVPTAGPDISMLTRQLGRPLVLFTFGVLLGAVAMGTTYLTQVAFKTSEQRGEQCRRLTIVLVGGALLAFAAGVGGAYWVFVSWP
jgi:hypothetical protein